jgi:AcrR family transcriptional regulator
MSSRPYRARPQTRSQTTRARILAAVRELLAEGEFHAATMERVADRAGVSRATLYQHFRSRLDLVDAICETFAVNPALLELRGAVEDDDAEAALARGVQLSMRFWASEDAVLRELYGVAAVDPAAQALVDRQRADRRSVMERLARHLGRAGRLRPGLTPATALPVLMLVTSYESLRELRAAGLSDRQAVAALQESARGLLFGAPDLA